MKMKNVGKMFGISMSYLGVVHLISGIAQSDVVVTVFFFPHVSLVYDCCVNSKGEKKNSRLVKKKDVSFTKLIKDIVRMIIMQ